MGALSNLFILGITSVFGLSATMGSEIAGCEILGGKTLDKAQVFSDTLERLTLFRNLAIDATPLNQSYDREANLHLIYERAGADKVKATILRLNQHAIDNPTHGERIQFRRTGILEMYTPLGLTSQSERETRVVKAKARYERVLSFAVRNILKHIDVSKNEIFELYADMIDAASDYFEALNLPFTIRSRLPSATWVRIDHLYFELTGLAEGRSQVRYDPIGDYRTLRDVFRPEQVKAEEEAFRGEDERLLDQQAAYDRARGEELAVRGAQSREMRQPRTPDAGLRNLNASLATQQQEAQRVVVERARAAQKRIIAINTLLEDVRLRHIILRRGPLRVDGVLVPQSVRLTASRVKITLESLPQEAPYTFRDTLVPANHYLLKVADPAHDKPRYLPVPAKTIDRALE